MKAIEISRQGVPVSDNVLLNAERDAPAPGPGEVLVRTEASALNQLDLWVGRGLPGLERSFPAISGSDGVGIIESVGDGVDEGWVGRRVVLNAGIPIPVPPQPDVVPAPSDILMIGEHVSGTMAEFFVAPVGNVLDVGDADPVETAAFGLVHLTAWRMLVTRARVRPGSTVLVTGIGGGVALACLGIAKMMSCRVIVTSRSREKLDRAMELGADEGVLDEGVDFSREVRGLTGRRGVDVCADSVGKAIHLAGVKSLARGGVYVTCGCTTGPDATTDLARVFWNQLSILGSTMGDMDEFRQVLAHFRSGRLRPVIDSIHAPGSCENAYKRLEAGAQFGKIVVDWRLG
ncbi:MAG: zinc-binding dehydrogenase [Phycisphaerales bacterium]|nr:zinc-binding dehydrogenase [Phycisphaerales bacterium]